MGEAAAAALEGASRRELQALAKDLQLCRGNARSDVIIGHAVKFMEEHPTNGEAMVLASLGGKEMPTPTASPATKSPKKTTPKKDIEAAAAKKSKSPMRQPQPEPAVETPSAEKKTTPTKKQQQPDADKTQRKKQGKKQGIVSKDEMKTKQTTPSSTPAVNLQKSTPKATPESRSKPSPAKTGFIEKKEKPSKKAAAAARKAVEGLVKSKGDLSFIGETRVRCSTTGHEMKADVETIKTYITGKRYQKALNLKWSIASYAPMFAAHLDESKKDLVWCNVTETAIARDRKSVEKHIAAHKYQNQLPIWQEQEAAKKKAAEEEAQRRAARIEAAKKRRLAAASEGEENAEENQRPAKRAKTSKK